MPIVWMALQWTAWMTDESNILRGDIWLVDFGTDPTDPEQAFHRPAVVVSDDRLHHPNLALAIVVPGTSTVRSVPLHVVVDPDADNGLAMTTAFQVEQVRAVSVRHLLQRLGHLDSPTLYSIDDVLRNALHL